MKRIVFVCSMAVAVSVASWSSAQTNPTAKPKRLDNRSVLMAWTNKEPAAKVEPAEAPEEAAPGTSATTRTNAPAAVHGDPELDQQVEEASKLLRSGKIDEGIQILKSVLAKDPKHQRGRFELATSYIQQDRYRDALDILEPMAIEFPDDYFLKNNLAWLYATARDPSIRNGEKAIHVAQDALFIAPNDFHVWSTLSEAYYIAGQYDKALRAAEEALRLATQSGLAGRALEEYQRQATKSQKAVEAMSVLE